ncbi:MAG: DMT family transporter [Dehalococcoidales bacterium]|nr:DMT family transporter [Dehalococcoidales bacterium]
MPRYAVYLMLLFAVGAWGGSFVAARLLLAPTAPGATVLTPTLVATLRFLVASAVFLPLLYSEQRRGRGLGVADLPRFLLLGQLGISIYFWLQYTGVQLTNAGISAVLVVGLIPLATLVISALTLGERLGRARVLALAVGAVGVAVIAGQRGLDLALESGFLLGAACLVANAFCFAVYTSWVRGLRDRYSPLATTAGLMLTGTAGLLAISLPSDDWSVVGALDGGQWLAVLYLGLASSVLAYFFYNYALSRLEASKVAVWVYLEPPVAVVFGALLLGEVATLPTLLGALLILVSLVVVQRY